MKIKYKTYSINLNEDLMNKKGIDTPEKIKVLKDSYKAMWKIFEQTENSNDNNFLCTVAELVQNAEFNIQTAWGFKQDLKQCKYLFEVPKCICPKTDNIDRIGTEYRVYDMKCPIHGSSAQKLRLRVKKMKRVKKIK